jgi:predicted dehydrogenase
MPKHRRVLIESAGKRGIPMLIEKPWAGTVESGKELVELCNSFDLPCQVEFPIRCMPAMVRLRELINADLGNGWMANANLMMGWCPPPESKHWDPENHNGLLNECYVHLFDTLAFLLGKPKSAFSFGGSFRGSPMPDAASAVIEFESGASASLTCGGIGAACADGGHLLDIWTENGLARITGTQWLPDTLEWALREAKESTVETFQAPERMTLMEYNMRAFFNAVRRGDPVAATPEDGLIATAMAMAIQESIITGNRVAIDC